jgi:hypothetical protein
MCTQIFNSVSCWDIFSLFLGAILSGIVTILLIQFFKPIICFELPSIVPVEDKKILKLPVKNLSKCFAAVNLRAEAAVVFEDKTYHFDLDQHDFIMLSPKKNIQGETPHKRTYQSCDVSSFMKKTYEFKEIDELFDILKNKDAYLRVRIHAYHEFSGFGKAFQATFNYKDGVFTTRSNKNICCNTD